MDTNTHREFNMVLDCAYKISGIPPGDLLTLKRTPAHVNVRHAVCWMLAKHLDWSYSEIARHFRMDHTSIIYAVLRVRTSAKEYKAGNTHHAQLVACCKSLKSVYVSALVKDDALGGEQP